MVSVGDERKSALELDQELTHRLTNERAHTIETIPLIAEIDRRQTFVELGFSSSWDYLRRVQRQSDTMIHYRLGCARAVNRFPQVVEPLRDGRLCMTTLAELMKAMTDQNCDELLNRALGKSSREAKRIVAAEKPKQVPQREVRRSLVAPQVTEAQTDASAATERPSLGPASEQPVGSESKKRRGIVDKPRATKVGKNGKISQSVKRIVEQRDGGRCQWRSEDGGICGSTHRIQFHHIQDRGKGGEGTPDNVIQLCQKHNLLAAEIAWGEQYIERFRKRPRQQAPEDLQSRLDFTEPH